MIDDHLDCTLSGISIPIAVSYGMAICLVASIARGFFHYLDKELYLIQRTFC